MPPSDPSIVLPRSVAPAASSWRAELWFRARRHFLLKFVGTTAYVWLFFIGYFHLLRHPSQPPVDMPLTAFDLWLPAQPAMLLPYLSLWFYIGVGPGLELRLRELLAYGLWVGALCLTGLTLFWLWPNQVPAAWRAEVAALPVFSLLHGVDAAGNACPSMHVAAAVFTAMRVHDTLRRCGAPALLRWVNAGWCLAIAYSTVAVRQHVLVDALSGAALGALFAWPSLVWRPGAVRLAPADAAAPQVARY